MKRLSHRKMKVTEGQSHCNNQVGYMVPTLGVTLLTKVRVLLSLSSLLTCKAVLHLIAASSLFESSTHLTARAPLSFLLLASNYSGCPHRSGKARV